MGKNIILCADGTGNKGGYTPSSNVYKIYNAININDNPQIRFYDNGIGTEKNKYYRGLAGAFGLGFKSNVIDLYVYLAKNYNPDDQVYLFGFSRGAATIRAFAGFIATCGLIDGRKLDKYELKDRVNEAFGAYKRLRKKKLQADQTKFQTEQMKFIDKHKSHGIIPIKFIGIWDTVSSLGFPQKWDKTGVGIFMLNLFFMGMDRISDLVLPHNFYNYNLTNNIKYACQALAIDDERTSFWPKVWIEKEYSRHVEQVWFAGMHSNVGGGYNRTGMATVTLEWMMEKSGAQGLVFNDDTLRNVHDNADVHGRMYNSREGLSIYYRYHPREIEKVCNGKLKDTIKIHESVIDRMRRKTANYAPGLLPIDFEVVDNKGDVKEVTSETGRKARETLKQKIKWWIYLRKWLYGIFLESSLVVAFFVWWWRNTPLDYLKPQCVSDCAEKSGEFVMSPVLWTEYVADSLTYILPDFCNGAITRGVLENPWYFVGTLLLFLSYWALRVFFKNRTDRYCEALRKNILASLQPSVKDEVSE
ncbi:MAG: DUF2235 domain-containing protein [Candidatus Brocadiales bacterium]|nr:DUF2235 domain-containing protein [Candidatus Brocadiales bacterium]